MTTSISFDLVENLSYINNTLRLKVRKDLRVAGAVWIAPVTGLLVEVRLDCLRYAIGRLAARWPDWELWLVAGQPGFQTDNRIARYQGIWKMMQSAGLPVSGRENIIEVMHAMDGSIRFFGGVHIDFTHLSAAHTVLREQSSTLIFSQKEDAEEIVKQVLQKGWERYGTNPPEEVLEIASEKGCLVVAAYGSFDDREVAVAAIGKKELVAEIEP